MSKKFDRRLLDTNAMVMGGGVGLAALESMFNLVQTQSLLSASMVRDHDLSHGLSLEALALSLGDILESGAYGGCRSCRSTDKTKIDIPVSAAKNDEDLGSRHGAISGADALTDLVHGNQNTTTTTTQTTDPGVSLDKLLMEIFELLGGHLGHLTQHMDKVTDASRNRLMVS